ncbi:hypothetical protein NMY22_g9786 [Coprinellus aureogranulatus]|nr:hypothetical protein NMY22_g9786 [Coprinellus aureogranulatus]
MRNSENGTRSRTTERPEESIISNLYKPTFLRSKRNCLITIAVPLPATIQTHTSKFLLQQSPILPHSRKWIEHNEPLSDSASADLDTFLKTRSAELSALDQEIDALQQTLEQRRNIRDSFREAVDAGRRLLHPPPRLPTEVLQQIFLYCRPTHRLPFICKEECPLLLTRVCREWRSVALGMPFLWNEIHIPIPLSFAKPSTQFYLNCAERWLDRAKEKPLSISIWSQCGPTTTGDGPLEGFIRRVILDRAPRIRHLIIDLDQDLRNLVACTLPPDTWASLEKVTLKRVEEFQDQDEPTFKPTEELSIWEAPMLRRVRWESVQADVLALPLKWETLEEISITVEQPPMHGHSEEEWIQFSASEAHALIRDSPAIRHLKVHLNDDGEEFFLEGQLNNGPITLETPFVLNQLTTLDLDNMYLDPAGAPVVFLRGLQLPALERLSYKLKTSHQDTTLETGVAPLPHGDAHPLVAFLKSQKSPIRIKSFRIASTFPTWTISQDDFVECLTMMSMLENLWVEDFRFVNLSSHEPDPQAGIAPNVTLLRRFQPPGQDASQILCPRLTKLRIDRMENVKLVDIEAFVRDRLAMAGAFPLQVGSSTPLVSLPSSTANDESSSPPENFAGVAQLERLYLGTTILKPDHVPRNNPSRKGRPSCALEEDFWEAGIDARFWLRDATWDDQEREFTEEYYRPYDGILGFDSAEWDEWVWDE